VVEEIRGNVSTRLRKLRASTVLEGTVLAQAGLDRLGFYIEQGRLDFEGGSFYAEPLEMLPAIGQGAIALQSRRADRALFAAVNHESTWLAVRAERELMRLLHGDCTLPVGVATALEDSSAAEQKMTMRVILFSTPGEPPRRAQVEGPASAPEEVAAAAFRALG
jgi:hydroxymethylbilane synthase